MKTTIEVEISNIEVNDGYYSFDYVITVNGKKRKKESYDSDFDGQTAAQFKKVLEKGYGVELALQDFTL